jgi:hypothetical protein
VKDLFYCRYESIDSPLRHCIIRNVLQDSYMFTTLISLRELDDVIIYFACSPFFLISRLSLDIAQGEKRPQTEQPHKHLATVPANRPTVGPHQHLYHLSYSVSIASFPKANTSSPACTVQTGSPIQAPPTTPSDMDPVRSPCQPPP